MISFNLQCGAFLIFLLLHTLLFLIFVNDLEEGIKSKIMFFADDISLFSIVHDPSLSALELNHDLGLISKRAA